MHLTNCKNPSRMLVCIKFLFKRVHAAHVNYFSCTLAEKEIYNFVYFFQYMSGLNESNWFDFDSITYIEIKRQGNKNFQHVLILHPEMNGRNGTSNDKMYLINNQ